jgi:hypothetical protein
MTRVVSEENRAHSEGGEIPEARVWRPPQAPVSAQPPVVNPSPPPPPPPPPIYPPAPPLPDYVGAYGGYGGAMYALPAKPGVVTAIGVVSIVLASLSIITSAVSSVQALVQTAFLSTYRVVASVTAARAAQAAAQAAATQPTAASSQGLAFDQRQIAIAEISKLQPLSAAREAQLDDLLAQAGQTMLKLRPGQVSPAAVRQAIVSSSRGRSLGPGQPGPALLETLGGRIELYDGNGVFRGSDKSQRTVRSAADVNHYQVVTGAVPAPPVTSIPAAPPPAPPRFDRGVVGFVLCDCFMSFAIAVYLLVIGILTVRGSRAGGKLHLAYALLKLPLLVFGAYAWWRFQQNFAAAVFSIQQLQTQGSVPASVRASISTGLGESAIWLAGMAAIYPIALLIVLMTSKSAREYFQPA